MSFRRIPSTITSVKSLSPPRGKIDVTAPRPPLRETVNPGTDRRASCELSSCLVRSSASSRTVSVAPLADRVSGTNPADTTICSVTAATPIVTSAVASSASRRVTRWGLASKPSATTRRTYSPSGASSTNVPAAVVRVVATGPVGPSRTTLALAIGCAGAAGDRAADPGREGRHRQQQQQHPGRGQGVGANHSTSSAFPRADAAARHAPTGRGLARRKVS